VVANSEKNIVDSEPDQPAKILEIGVYPPPFCGWGTRLYFVRLALHESGHQCVTLNIGKNRKIPSDEYECVRSGWEYVRKIVRYLARGYVVHMHVNGSSLKGFVLSGIAYVLSLLTFRRPILTLHAGTQQRFFPKSRSRLMAPILRVLFTIPKLVICNNSNVKDLIVDYSINPDKIVPITPFSKQYIAADPAPLSQEVDAFLDQHSPRIFTYLEMRPEYATESLIGAVAGLRDSHPNMGLIIVGVKENQEELLKRLDALNLSDCCFIVGTVSHEIFLSLLRKCDVYLRSNRQEGTSSSIRESIYLGTPVIADGIGDHPEGVITYPWGDGIAMQKSLIEFFAEESEDRSSMNEAPDTVAIEANLLARCALGRPWKRAAHQEVRQCD
tara:strand:- start:1266 stop:2420 length:1155 start_codon:yes stop_codon:yes gene_type:complete